MLPVCSKACVILCGADLFAGTRDPGQTVTVPQGELDLDIDSLRSFPADVTRPQPVVLVSLHDVTHLVGPHWGVPLIHHTNLLPLRMKRKKWKKKVYCNMFILLYYRFGIFQPLSMSFCFFRWRARKRSGTKGKEDGRKQGSRLRG